MTLPSNQSIIEHFGLLCIIVLLTTYLLDFLQALKMPGKVKVKIVAGRNLPVMDRSSDTTDAFVEVKLIVL